MRIGAAEFFVTNVLARVRWHVPSFGATTDQGLRTLAGGQIVDSGGRVPGDSDGRGAAAGDGGSAGARDIFAVVSEAPSGGAVDIADSMQGQHGVLHADDRGRRDDFEYRGWIRAAAAGGGSQISLDIRDVPGAANTLPGRDLTVIIRL